MDILRSALEELASQEIQEKKWPSEAHPNSYTEAMENLLSDSNFDNEMQSGHRPVISNTTDAIILEIGEIYEACGESFFDVESIRGLKMDRIRRLAKDALSSLH